MMQTFLFLCVPIALCFGWQTVDLEKWYTVERMCGKVEWLERTPAKRNPSSYDEKRTPVKNAEIRLYPREKDVPCCGTNSPAAQAKTNRDGIFKLANDAPGSYWIVVVADGKKYSHAIKYVPDPKAKDQISCSDLLYDLTARGLELGRMITVD